MREGERERGSSTSQSDGDSSSSPSGSPAKAEVPFLHHMLRVPLMPSEVSGDSAEILASSALVDGCDSCGGRDLMLRLVMVLLSSRCERSKRFQRDMRLLREGERESVLVRLSQLNPLSILLLRDARERESVQSYQRERETETA